MGIIIDLIVGFAVGTIILWICSKLIDTEYSTIKSAVIANGINTLISIIAIIIIYILYQSDAPDMAGITVMILTLAIMFIVIKKIYAVSIWTTLWLVILTWAADKGADKLTNAIL